MMIISAFMVTFNLSLPEFSNLTSCKTMLRSSTVQHFSCYPGRPSSPRRTQPASPATEAAESALDPDPTTVSPALLKTPSLQVQHCFFGSNSNGQIITLLTQVPAFPPAHQANTR